MKLELCLEIVGRNLIVLVCLAAGLRLLGKRQLGQFNVYDLAMIMAVANAVQNAMTTGSGILGVGLLSAGTLLVCGKVLSRLFFRYPTLESRVAGTPTILLHDGCLSHDRMRRERVSEEQIMVALREHGMAGPAEAKLVVLEVDGSLSVVPADQPSRHARKKRSRLRSV